MVREKRCLKRVVMLLKNDLKELFLRIVRQTRRLLVSHLSSELLVGNPQNNDDVKWGHHNCVDERCSSHMCVTIRFFCLHRFRLINREIIAKPYITNSVSICSEARIARWLIHGKKFRNSEEKEKRDCFTFQRRNLSGIILLDVILCSLVPGVRRYGMYNRDHKWSDVSLFPSLILFGSCQRNIVKIRSLKRVKNKILSTKIKSKTKKLQRNTTCWSTNLQLYREKRSAAFQNALKNTQAESQAEYSPLPSCWAPVSFSLDKIKGV